MAATLYLVRHGATEGSGERRYYGSTDVPLSAEGRRQADEAARFIRRHLHEAQAAEAGASGGRAKPASISECADSLAAVYSSGMARAVRSAELIGAPYGLVPLIADDLRERGFGRWEGMTLADIQKEFPAEFEAWAEDPLRYCPSGGESTLQVRERVLAVFSSIIERHADEQIAIVAHGGVNRIILCHLLGVPLAHLFRIEQDYAAVNIVEFGPEGPVATLLNGRRDG